MIYKKNNFRDVYNCKILVCCHKDCQLPSNSLLAPIVCGSGADRPKTHDAENSIPNSGQFNVFRDNECLGELCDNISEKNPWYAELTGLYWAWKNIRNVYPEITHIGLNHYRRYFLIDKKMRQPIDKVICPVTELDNYDINSSLLNRILFSHDCIVQKPRKFPYSLWMQYCDAHMSNDIRLLRKEIENRHIDYLDSFDYVMKENNTFSEFNMFIMKYEIFERYSSWLFDILFSLENKVNYRAYSDDQRRVFGFLGERMLNIWLYHNREGIKVKYYPVVEFRDSGSVNQLRRYISMQKKNLAWFFSRPFLSDI